MSCNGRTIVIFLMFMLGLIGGVVSIDYGSALTKSLLYYEGQRSGKLPSDQRVQWRGDSGLKDGGDVGIDLVGGYYDAGDNMKFGFPMAFTVTMLAWSSIEFRDKLESGDELSNALAAVKWGTDYLIKAHSSAGVLYGQVGDGDADHACWERPEDMTTPRSSFKIDDQHPGADLAAETSAALAAASVAFNPTDPTYAALLLTHAKQLFDFAKDHPGTYQSSISGAGEFYSSSGFELHGFTGATNDESYLGYLGSPSSGTGGTRTVFSWDDKYVGAQVLVAKLVLEGKVDGSGTWSQYKSQAEQFICNCLQKGNANVVKSPGGLLWFMEWDNLQYTISASFISAVYALYLAPKHASIQCPAGLAQPSDLSALAQSQVDYILGSNPKSMSYMVGFGSSYPTQPHHRGASIVSIKKDPTPVTCQGGFDTWFNKNEDNPNVLDGAVVGGPDANDEYSDVRSNFKSAEPTTVTVAPFLGLLASLV